MFHRQDPGTCNAGTKWTSEDDNMLMEMARADIANEEIAKYFKRTRRSIRTRIKRNILSMVDEHNSLEDLSKLYGIALEELNKERVKQDASKTRTAREEERPIDVLIEIRDLLRDLLAVSERPASQPRYRFC